ncbi:MAG: DUF167 domain-containing protein [Candidatus Auribacterota bacterium]|nr:DUF167 domain-containing protein [Candidatus Auribacterota bacterium]
MNQFEIRETKSGVIIEVKLHPRAGRDRIAGVMGNKLKIDVSAAPVKNKANKSMIKLLSKTLKVPQKAIVIRRGMTSRNKLIEISSISSEELKMIFFSKKKI